MVERSRLLPAFFTKLEHPMAVPFTWLGQDLGGRQEDSLYHPHEVKQMKLLGRRTAWLGWIVAGVLALSVGGAAFAATQQSSSTDQRPGGLGFAFAQANADGKGNGDPLGGRARFGGGLGGAHFKGRALHGQVTVQADDGVKTYVFASGKVTALSGSSITVTSSDNVATTFAINGDTRYGFQNFSEPQAELKTGQTARVIGTRSGDANTATRIVTFQNPPDSTR